MTDGGDQIFCLDRVRIRDCLFTISPFWPTSLFSLQWKDRGGKSVSRQPADNQITQGTCGTFDQCGPSFYSKSDSVPKGVFVKGDKQEKPQACVRFLGFFIQVSCFCFICFCLILSSVSVWRWSYLEQCWSVPLASLPGVRFHRKPPLKSNFKQHFLFTIVT